MFKIISQKAQQAAIAEATATLQAEVTKLKGQLAASFSLDTEEGNNLIKEEVKKALSELTAKHEKALADLKVGYEKQISDLKATVAVESVSSEAKAIAIVSQIGVPSDELPKVTTKEDKTQILEQVSKLSGDELANFLTKNYKAVAEALKVRNNK